MIGAEKAEMLAAIENLDRLYGEIERAKKSGEDYTLDTLAVPLMATMKMVGVLASRLAGSLP